MDNGLVAWVFNKLMRRGYWGRRLINEGILPKGIIKEKRREIIEIANELVNHGFLLKKKGRFGWRYSLNSHRKNEIIEFVEKHFGELGEK